METGEIIIYQSETGSPEIRVTLENETLWLSQRAMAELFDKDTDTIGLHIKNIFSEGELGEKATTELFSVVQKEGNRNVKRNVTHYNLDVILSVGYRVSSKRGTQFRIWANKVLKEYLVKGYALNEKRLKDQAQQFADLKQTVRLLGNVLEAKSLTTDEAGGLLKVLTDYTYALDVLDKYDHRNLTIEAVHKKEAFVATYEEAMKAIKGLIAQNSISREIIAMLFQRQNFFVKTDSLNFERSKLLNTLLAKDTAAIKQYQENYQINAIQKFYASADGIPIRVRLFEFILPLLKYFEVKNDTLQPDTENLYFSSLPLIEAYNNNKIQPAAMQFIRQHSLKTKVFILAGRWDHTADYRSQIALTATYPNNILFIADDNHTFNKLKNNGKYQKLILAFFESESISNMQALIKNEYRHYRWRE